MQAPWAPVMFNYNAQSSHWAVQRRLPLTRNCTGSPGTDLVRMILPEYQPLLTLRRASTSFVRFAKSLNNETHMRRLETPNEAK